CARWGDYDAWFAYW
nr:immunoglobulin heavy chain junction region [Mus musculus]